MKKLLTILLFGALAFAQSGTAPAPASDKKAEPKAKKEMKCDAEMKCCKKEGKHEAKHEGKAEGHDKHAKDGKSEHAKMDCCKEGMCERKPMKEDAKEKKG